MPLFRGVISKGVGKEGRVEGMKGRRVEQKFFSRLKASIPGVQTTFHSIHNIRYFVAFSAAGGIPYRLKGANSIYN
jgi:hypothetical protein